MKYLICSLTMLFCAKVTRTEDTLHTLIDCYTKQNQSHHYQHPPPEIECMTQIPYSFKNSLLTYQYPELHQAMRLPITTASANEDESSLDHPPPFDNINFNQFCELASFTDYFVTSQTPSVLVFSKEHKHLLEKYENSKCPGSSKKPISPSHNDIRWFIDTLDTKVIQTSIEGLMNEGLQRFVLVCSLECTSLVLQIASNVNFYETEPIFFIFYRTPLFILEKLPRMVIALERQLIRTSNSSSQTSNTSIESFPFFNLYALDIFKRNWNTINPTRLSDKHFDESFQISLRGYPVTHFAAGGEEANNASFLRSTLRVVTIAEDPYIKVVQYSNVYDRELKKCNTGRVCWKENRLDDALNEAFCCVGYLIELLEQLEQDLMFETFLYFVDDNKYGEIVNGTWVGMVGDLVAGKADLVLASLTINSERAEVVDFSNPFLVGGIILITMLEEKTLSFFNVEPFKSISVTLWAAVLIIPALTIGLLVTTERATGKRYFWKDSFLYIMGLAFQRDMGGKNPYMWSSKVIALSIAMFTMVVMSTYTANLTANSVTFTKNLPISGFDDDKIKQPSSEFRYGTVASSAYTQLFANSEDPVWNRMALFMKEYNFTNTTKAFEQLANGDLQALIHDYFIAYHNLAKDKECRFKFAGKSIKDGGSGLAVRKGSYLAEQITDLVLRYQDREIFFKLQRKWMVNTCSSSSSSSFSSSSGVSLGDSDGAKQIGKEYFGGLFVALCSVVLISMLVFALEFYTRKRFYGRE